MFATDILILPTIRRKNGETIFIKSVERILNKFIFFLSANDKILDLDSGTCMFTRILKNKGFNITPVDIKNRSYYEDITPIIYDGKKLPFKNDSFDMCMLIAVLHHTQNPEIVLKEAMRVSKKIILLEDIYTNTPQKLYTYFIDSLLNKEFIGHPHTNKMNSEWLALFKKLGLKLVKKEYSKAYGFLQNATYYLEKI